MDFEDIFSSDSEHTVSKTTDTEHNEHKTKRIYKKYEPLQESGRTYRYEEDPVEYRKIRKKVQNRESATRVRGRKKNAFQTVQQEVEELKQTNAALQLQNARLQMENKSLKDQVNFMRSLVKQPEKDPIDSFLDFSVEEMEPEWGRASHNDSYSLQWTALGIFTIVLAVFVLPQADNQVIIAFQQGQTVAANSDKMDIFAFYAKQIIKYALIGMYLWFAFTFGKKFIKRSKFKRS